jgi:hypothetical protein
MAPNNFPVRAALIPRAVKVTAKPQTYATEIINARNLDGSWRAPINPTIIGMTGKMQGVKLVIMPAKNTSKYAPALKEAN